MFTNTKINYMETKTTVLENNSKEKTVVEDVEDKNLVWNKNMDALKTRLGLTELQILMLPSFMPIEKIIEFVEGKIH